MTLNHTEDTTQTIQRKREYRIGAFLSFLLSFILYCLTVAPTVSFWDCGEFIACSYTMGIPHPPGAPLFIMIGRVFTLFPFFDIALRVNMISVFASAFSVTILYLMIVRLTYEWRGEPKSFRDNMIVIVSALFGSLTFAVTDTQWFNAVEAEVYALSMLMTALVFWLALLWMDNHKDPRSVRFLIAIAYIFLLGACIHLLNLLVIPSILAMIWFTDRRVLLRGDLWTWSMVIAVLGFSAYLMVLIRSGLNPIIDQNNPETWANFSDYFQRKQYGTQSQFLTFTDRIAPLWEYQIKKMYLRYFGWQFIGKGTTLGPDRFIAENLSFNGLYGLPFAAGLLGFFYHFRKDWRNALAMLLFFVMTGIAIVIYLNQPDPQPRERDYVYVGSFMAFSFWIGYGMLGALDSIVEAFRENGAARRGLLVAATVVMTILIPVNMIRVNYHEHDRTGNYLAWDYSYNILNSCEPDAILFTNGDNDTFPLWYLQEVEGIRQDVNIVNLSLVNTPWYIMQLKHGARPVPVALTDEQIQNLSVYRLEKTIPIKINVAADVAKAYMPEMQGTYPLLGAKDEVMEWDLAPTYMGQYLRVQDVMVLNILQANQFKRPIYFAITVAPGNFLGLRDFFRMDGLTYKILPIKGYSVLPELLARRLYEEFRYRCPNDPDVYYDLSNCTLLQNYRNGHINLAVTEINRGQNANALKALQHMESMVPEWRIPVGDHDVALQLARLWYTAGAPDTAIAKIKALDANSALAPAQRFDIARNLHQFMGQTDLAIDIMKQLTAADTANGQFTGYLLNLYESTNDHASAISVLESWLRTHPIDQAAAQKLAELKAKLAAQ